MDPIVALLVVDLDEAVVEVKREVEVQQCLALNVPFVDVIADDALIVALVALLGAHVGLLHLHLAQPRLLLAELHEGDQDEEPLSGQFLDVDEVRAEVLALDAAVVEDGEEAEEDAVVVLVDGDLNVELDGSAQEGVDELDGHPQELELFVGEEGGVADDEIQHVDQLAQQRLLVDGRPRKQLLEVEVERLRAGQQHLHHHVVIQSHQVISLHTPS